MNDTAQQNTAMEIDTKQVVATMEVDEEGDKPAANTENKKKRTPPSGASESKENSENQLIVFLKEQAERAQKQIELKDEQIKTLMAQIVNLTNEVKALREDIKAAQPPVEADNDEHL